MRRLLLGLLACVLVATVLCAAPASAESGHKAKEKGNAPAAIDITAIYANNAQNRVTVKLVVPGLTRKGKFTIGYETATYDGMAIIVREVDHRVMSEAWHCGEDSCKKVQCQGVRIRWNDAASYLRVSIPQSCYPLDIPSAWNFNGFSDLGDEYDSEYTKLRLSRG
jgi:hypothetical protein